MLCGKDISHYLEVLMEADPLYEALKERQPGLNWDGLATNPRFLSSVNHTLGESDGFSKLRMNPAGRISPIVSRRVDGDALVNARTNEIC